MSLRLSRGACTEVVIKPAGGLLAERFKPFVELGLHGGADGNSEVVAGDRGLKAKANGGDFVSCFFCGSGHLSWPVRRFG